jgi:hypothetical protein
MDLAIRQAQATKLSLAADATAGTSNINGNVNFGGTVCGNSVTQPVSSYWLNAVPVTPGGTGTRYFASDTRGTIWQDATAAVANPIVASATTVPVQ